MTNEVKTIYFILLSYTYLRGKIESHFTHKIFNMSIKCDHIKS